MQGAPCDCQARLEIFSVDMVYVVVEYHAIQCTLSLLQKFSLTPIAKLVLIIYRRVLR